MRRTAVLLAVLTIILEGCVPFPGCVTADIEGLVIDAASKAPISDAVITSREYADLLTVSDPNGRFFLRRKVDLICLVLIGDRITFNPLRIEKTGYESQSVDLCGWPPCGPTKTTIELVPKAGD